MDDVDISLGIVCGLLLSLIAWSLVALRLTARGRFDLVDIFVLSLGTVYGIAYAFVIYATGVGQNGGGFRIIGLERFYWLIPAIALLCVASSLLLATFVPAVSGRLREPPAGRVPSEITWRRFVPMAGWLFLGIAMLSWSLYTSAYGGFSGFLEVSGALRSGLFEEAGDNPLSFLKPFGGFSIFSSYLFASAWLGEAKGRRGWNGAGFAISFIVASATLFGWGGRVDLLVYWMTVLFGLLVYRVGVMPRLLAGVLALVIALIAVMPPLTDVMNPGKSRESYVAFFAAELTFPVESSLNSLELPQHRYGIDLLAAPLFLLPERIWGELNIRTVSDLNSEALLGDVVREGFGYTIPADFITFGFYQFGLAGPLIIAVLWSLMLTKLDDLLVTGLPRSLAAFAYAHCVFSIAVLSTLYVDPKMQIARNFHFIVGMVFILAVLWRGLAGQPARGRA